MKLLETIDAYMPQLEYVVKCWDCILEGEGYGYNMAIQFANHYNGNRKVRDQKFQAYLDRFPSYIEDDYTKIVLKAYGIDPEKFWYLLLMAADFTENFGPYIFVNDAPSAQLDRVFSLIKNNLQPHRLPALGYEFSHDPDMKLTLSVKEPGRKHNSLFTIDSPNALAYLTRLLEENKTNSPKILDMRIGGTFVDEQECVKREKTKKLACFTTILMAFLKPLKATPGIADSRYPKDKYFMIAQYVYILGLSSEDILRKIYHRHYLKDLIKDYKDIYILGDNRYYTFDFDID